VAKITPPELAGVEDAVVVFMGASFLTRIPKRPPLLQSSFDKEPVLDVRPMSPARARAALASRDLQFKVFHAYLYYW